MKPNKPSNQTQPYRSRLRLPHVSVAHVQALHKGLPWQRISLIATPVLLVIGGLCFVAYGTSLTVRGISSGQYNWDLGKSDSQLASELQSRAAAYRFTVAADGKPAQTYSLADAGVTIQAAPSVSVARLAARNLDWQRFMWWGKTDIPLTVAIDKTKFEAFTKKHITGNDTPAVNAALKVDGGRAVIADGKDGSTFTLPGGNRSLVRAAEGLRPLSAITVIAPLKPTLNVGDLASAKQKADSYLAHDVTFTIGDKTITAGPADIAGWLDIDPVPTKKTVDVSVNSGKLQAFLTAKTKNSIYPPKAQITTTAADGTVSILIPGQSGSDITNEDAAVKQVTADLAKPERSIASTLNVEHKNFTTISAADYPKWIVADLTAKRMYAYEHGTQIRSFLISAGAPKTPTVTGTYQIYSKYTTKDMRGRNADGSRYFQPKVKFASFFYKDYAIHGNYWRPKSYFGNINSSHGCVGITDSDAEWLYNWAPIGTTVITHN